MGAWGGLRVVLDCENGQLGVLDPFDCAVIEVKVGDLKSVRPRHAPPITPHRETVVLGRYKHLSCRKIPDRMVPAAMPVGELDRLAT